PDEDELGTLVEGLAGPLRCLLGLVHLIPEWVGDPGSVEGLPQRVQSGAVELLLAVSQHRYPIRHVCPIPEPALDQARSGGAVTVNAWPRRNGRCTRCSSGVGRPSHTCTSVRCTRPTTRWRCATPATSTPAGTRA